MRLKLFLLLLLTAVIPSLAQTTGVAGTVVDSNTGVPVSGATVMLDNQGLQATTDPSGEFRISTAKAGDDMLVIVAYGYQDVTMNVNIVNGVIDNLGIIKMLDSNLNNVFYEDQNDMLFDQNLLEDEEGSAQSIAALTGASDDVYYNSASYDFQPMRFRIRGYDSKYSETYINKANYASDSWLVSPEIDLSAQSAAFLSFDQALNFFASIETAKTETSVCIREAGTTAWTVLSVPAYPASMSWNFANSGDIDLAAFIGKKVEIGFHYTSTASKAGTWQIRNVLIETTANHPVTPDTPVNPPVAGDAIYSGLSENATSIDWTFEDNSAENVNEIWAWKSYNGLYYLNASAFVGGVAYPATAYACSPVIDLTAVTSAKMTFDQTAKFQTTLRTLCSVVVREEGASDWTELTVPAWPAAGSWDFVSAGEIDLSAYAGKKIQVGFKYGSSAEGADTWRVKNLKITE